MSRGRYLGAGLRIVGWYLLVLAVSHLATALVIGSVSSIDGGGTGRIALFAILAGVILIVVARLLFRQWPWLVRRLGARHGRLTLTRGALRAAALSALACIAAFMGLATLTRAAIHPLAGNEGIGMQALVYAIVILAAVFVGGLRAALVGVRGQGEEHGAEEVLTPRALEGAGRFALGLYLLVVAFASIVGALTSLLQDGAGWWGGGGYMVAALAMIGAIGGMGFVYVRRVLYERARRHPPLRLAAAVTGLVLLIQVAHPLAQALGGWFHGGHQPIWSGAFPHRGAWSFSVALSGWTPGAAVAAFAGAVALLAYARFGRGEQRILEAFD